MANETDPASTTATVVAGIDGCRGRWAVVMANGDRPITVELVDDIGPLVGLVRSGDVAAAAIDMPIGLLNSGPRPCDVAARSLLGHRHSTVFPAPARTTLAASDYANACDLSRAATGKALSKQTFNILAPIRQLDELLRPADADRIVEAHPELAFARLAGGPLPSKHKPEGRTARASVLRDAIGQSFDALIAQAAEVSVPSADLFDATALTITARHVAAGTEHRVGGEVDPTGKRAQVVY